MISIKCPVCKNNLKQSFKIGDLQILKCKCTEYPAYKDIIYLTNSGVKDRILDYIQHRQKIKAIKTILNLRYKLFLPLYILTETGIAKLLGFRNLIKVLVLFGYDINYSRYLLDRVRTPSYQISRALLNDTATKNGNVLDLGCGPGLLIPEIVKTVCPKNIVGIDISFLDLYFSKYFINGKNISYICYDIENRLPFKANTFDFIHTTDAFMYIKNKKQLIGEFSRVIKNNGILSITHTHQKNISNITGTDNNLITKLLKASEFKNINIAKDNSLLINLDLKYIPYLQNMDAYSLLASKSKITNKKIWHNNRFIVVSPHLDDAVLSATNLILQLKKLEQDVMVITVFTKHSDGPHSTKALEHMKRSGYDNAKDLFAVKKGEDVSALKRLGVKHKHLDFIDGAFRKDSNKNIIYKRDNLFLSKVSAKDSELIKKIESKLSKIVKKDNTILVSPMGIGGHVDHVIIRDILRKFKKPTIYWEDYPYNLEIKSVKAFFSKNKNYDLIYDIKNNTNTTKEKVIRLYRSQIGTLFPKNVIKNINEKFYIHHK